MVACFYPTVSCQTNPIVPRLRAALLSIWTSICSSRHAGGRISALDWTHLAAPSTQLDEEHSCLHPVGSFRLPEQSRGGIRSAVDNDGLFTPPRDPAFQGGGLRSPRTSRGHLEQFTPERVIKVGLPVLAEPPTPDTLRAAGPSPRPRERGSAASAAQPLVSAPGIAEAGALLHYMKQTSDMFHT